VGVAVNEAGGGRGVVAVSSLPAGHTMLFPPSLVLTVDKVRLSGVVPPACLQECTEEEVLALFLVLTKMRLRSQMNQEPTPPTQGQASDVCSDDRLLGAWLRSHPATFDHAFLWSEKELAFLEASPCRRMAERERSNLEGRWQLLDPLLQEAGVEVDRGVELFLWAHGAVASRAYGVTQRKGAAEPPCTAPEEEEGEEGESIGGDGTALCVWADMFNHDPFSDALYADDPLTGGLSFTFPGSHAVGDEVRVPFWNFNAIQRHFRTI